MSDQVFELFSPGDTARVKEIYEITPPPADDNERSRFLSVLYELNVLFGRREVKVLEVVEARFEAGDVILHPQIITIRSMHPLHRDDKPVRILGKWFTKA